MTRLHDLFEHQGQSPWLDNLRRDWIESGELDRWVRRGVRGAARGAPGGSAVAVAALAGVAISAPVAGAVILGASLVGGFFGADSATTMYHRFQNLDEVGKMDFFEQCSTIH